MYTAICRYSVVSTFNPSYTRQAVMLLSADNILDYLAEYSLYDKAIDAQTIQIKLLPAKNFNLLVTFPCGRQVLVKQERRNKDGKTAEEFKLEWFAHQLFSQIPAFASPQDSRSRVLHFDPEQSILVFEFLTEYTDLAQFYEQHRDYSPEITAAIGQSLGQIHQGTWGSQEVASKIAAMQADGELPPPQALYLTRSLQRVGPEIFGSVPSDGIKFFTLYQRFDSLGQAVAELGESMQPNCLAHNDLKLNNILLHQAWEDREPISRICLIDWERCGWGDPACDLGALVGSYLQLWLSSMVISQALKIEESLRLAAIPLDQLQPSMAALVISYCEAFPEILEQRSDFIQRVIQFAGLNLIQQIQGMIQYQKSFGNMGIAMLQVAKSLLCRPDAAMATLFGADANAVQNLTKVATVAS
jgi:hypothetical protein